MSHFTVLIIGPDPDKQLAPFDEQREVEPHMAECWNCDGDPEYQPCAECKDVGKLMSTTNPDGKWDYWRIGGRYRGFLRLHPGADGQLSELAWEYKDFPGHDEDWTDRADQALRGAVDLSRIQAECWDGERPYRTYAVVAEGAWKGRGDMGWFGCSRNERMSDVEWCEWWDRLVGGMPDDMLLTVADCHV